MHVQDHLVSLSRAGRIELESNQTHRNYMETIQFQVKGEYVRLCDLLKLTGIAASGAQGKHLVAEGNVTVDGLPESRKDGKDSRRASGGMPRRQDCRNGEVSQHQESTWNPASRKLKPN